MDGFPKSPFLVSVLLGIMRVTQGTFSFLPDLTDAQITKQIDYCLGKGWALAIEYTDDPHPRNTYWEMFGPPMFDLRDPAGIMLELANCRKTFSNYYIRMTAFDSSHGIESVVMAFIVDRPPRDAPSESLARLPDG